MLASTFINFPKCQRIQIALVFTPLPGHKDKTVILQFIQRLPQLVFAGPAPGFHNFICGAEVTVIVSLVLTGNV